MQFGEAGGHHHQVASQGVAPNQLDHRFQGILDHHRHTGTANHLVVLQATPLPGVGEGVYLSLRVCSTDCALEQHIVIAVAVEGGIEVDQVYALLGDQSAAQHRQIVAIKQGVLQVSHSFC